MNRETCFGVMATSSQIVKMIGFSASAIRDAVMEVNLSKDSADRVLDGHEEFTEAIKLMVVSIFRDPSVLVRPKEPEIVRGYFSGYSKPKSVETQVSILLELFPKLSPRSCIDVGVDSLVGPEGVFAIPRWQAVANTYCEAVQVVFNLLETLCGRGFKNERNNRIGPKYLRQSVNSVSAWECLSKRQSGNDILLLPAQFGKHRVGLKHGPLDDGEFYLGVFAGCVMLLTHMERLKSDKDLPLNLAGDEYDDSRYPGASFCCVPFIDFYKKVILFNTLSCGRENGGSLTGWVVQ